MLNLRASFGDKEIIESEIRDFLCSRRRRDMLCGIRYYDGMHDILARKRTVIGEGGELKEVYNLPNNRIVDNRYRKMVNQKVNYLLGKPITFRTSNNEYEKMLNKVFDRRFMRILKNIGRSALNCGLGWLFLYADENGLKFKRLNPYEIIPGWADEEHTELEYAIRIYDVLCRENVGDAAVKRVKKVEVYSKNGIHYFTEGENGLKREQPFKPYFNAINEYGEEISYNWNKIPLIPFKYNSEETPLINHVKALQDGLNLIVSNFQNNMEEDARNTILVLVNYDGERLDEFRKNLASYGAVKVKTIDGAPGDLRTLQVEVNAENYKAIIEIFKKAIVENAMGYDAKNDKMSGAPNQMNIQSMYCDIDLDANEMETEFQASFEQLMWFVNSYLYNTGAGYFDERPEVFFNRDMLINESEAIENCVKSEGIISKETIVANHPWTSDIHKEMENL